ncbi:MAG TPA: sigma-70 family RNA polymerase sigma factor [Nannocystaceae bacterium]|nr:sigma-70 family RNA polymerase sigma factor [Nannocystaceae bacterium]
MADEQPVIPPEFGQARERFLALVAELRPELHRYCARLVGSVVVGEDIVQESLAKAFYAISMASEVPPLRPWLFRVAHNTAIDHLRRYEARHVEPRAHFDETPDEIEPSDPAVTRAALSSFLELAVRQRCAVILKDVLGHSLEEIADTMGTTVPAVKAALVRGRAALRATSVEARPVIAVDLGERAKLERYVEHFNNHDWDALRAMMAEECRLDLVAKADRRGKEVHRYFSFYAGEPQTRLSVGYADGRPAILVHPDGAGPAAYFVLLEWAGDEVALIRDYRYTRYVAAEAELAALDG